MWICSRDSSPPLPSSRPNSVRSLVSWLGSSHPRQAPTLSSHLSGCDHIPQQSATCLAAYLVTIRRIPSNSKCRAPDTNNQERRKQEKSWLHEDYFLGPLIVVVVGMGLGLGFGKIIASSLIN